jgi:GT2 family glycosyltransferase
MRIAVVIATTGRPDVVERTAPLWARQSRPFDAMIISAAAAGDVGPSARAIAGCSVVLGPKGLCAQRNTALNALAGACDVVVFADDDYVPSRRFLEQTETILAANSDIVALTGHVLADGINTAGLSFETALHVVEEADSLPPPSRFTIIPAAHAYGCNMAIRVSAAPDLRFDERLPLYAWMEDLDFSRRIARVGRVARAMELLGVHMGVKSGRQSGVRLGYSQVANLAYLARKGSMPWSEALTQIARNVIANCVRVLKPEPWVDRQGRLRGNLLALRDGLAGVQSPERVLEL